MTMKQNDRQRLVSMVRGDSPDREVLFRLYPRDGEPRQEVIRVEGELPSPDPNNPLRFVFGCRPEFRDEVLRDSPCLVRQSDGRFKAVNTDKQGVAYLID